MSLGPVVAAGQNADTGALPAELRVQVRDGRFGIVTSIRGLPLGVRDALPALFRSRTLDIAEPGAEFQQTDVIVDPKLPTRRMAVAGCTLDLCILYYERGGYARTWHVALFSWTPNETRFLWGGSAPANLSTLDDVRNAILSGSVDTSQTRF